MRIYVAPAAPAPVTVTRKTNITRPSSIKAIKELVRLNSAVGGFDAGSNASKKFLVTGADLAVALRLIKYGFNLPIACANGSPRTNANVDGVGANPTI